MISKKEAVDNLEIQLRDFINSTVKAEDFDIVIPIMRKGLFLLERLFPANRPFKTYLMDPLEDRLPRNVVLEGKKVLLLDDSAGTGRTISNVKHGVVENNSAAEDKIRIGVFMKHKNCEVEIDYWSVTFDDTNRTELYGQLSGYFDSLCHQLDPDHMVVHGEITSKSRTFDRNHFLRCMKENLDTLGPNYRQNDSICRLWGRTKFAVVDLNPDSFGLDELKAFWEEEGTFKVRFCLEPGRTMYTVPIFCPKIIPPSSCEGKDCNAFLEPMFCKWSELHDEILCRDCINFNLTKAFAEKFIPMLRGKLRTQGYSYRISTITWSEIQLNYEKFQSKVFANLKSTELLTS